MFGMTWLKDTIGTLVVLEMVWYSAVIEKKLELLMLIFTDLITIDKVNGLEVYTNVSS